MGGMFASEKYFQKLLDYKFEIKNLFCNMVISGINSIYLVKAIYRSEVYI